MDRRFRHVPMDLFRRHPVTDDHTSRRRDTHDISESGDRYEALVDVLEHQKSQAARDREYEERQRQRRRERNTTPFWLVGILVLITAWLWLFPPSFLRMDPPPPQPIAEEEAALRFVMYVQAQRIRAYRMETGQYPDRLEDAGPPLPSMTYDRLSTDLYQLTGSTDRLTLTYMSDLPLDDFVRSGADAIEGGDL